MRIAISIGDYNGIGPEVILKSLQAVEAKEVTPVILGDEKIIDYYHQYLEKPIDYHVANSAGEITDGEINVLNCLDDEVIDINPGTLSASAGKCAMMAVETGIGLCLDHQADALVTSSISKEAVNKAGYNIKGHTEFLAEKTGAKDFIMMMVNEDLRLGLLSTHIPVKDVVAQLSTERIMRYIKVMHRSLTLDFGIDKPHIAVLALNPHAGDGGLIGTEEIEIIAPAVDKAQSENMLVKGPFPADGFFGSRNFNNFDGILAMYHDQGLIPFKALTFGTGVNFTAGLPIIRTSPDHGTAFDIAGKARANPASFQQAFELAAKMVQKRKKQPE